MNPNLFDYTDYKKYLADMYEAKKSENKGFSYNSLSLRAGFKNKGFIYNVIHGDKHLSKESAVRLSRALNHDRQESDYFENLVCFNQAPDLKERNYYYERLSSIKPKRRNMNETYKIRQDQYSYYADWRNSAVRSLIDLYPFKDDYKWLAKSLHPQIKPREAKKSVQLLEKLGLIIKGKDGFWHVSEKHITTGKEITGLAVQNFHQASAKLAAEALATLPKDKRNFSGLTLGISKATYDKICSEIAQVRAKIVEWADADSTADRVYQMNFQLFPVSNPDNNLNKSKQEA